MSPLATAQAQTGAAAPSVTPSAVPTICAWCRITLRAGDASLPPSHGVCPKCAARMLEGRDEHSPPPFVSRAARR